MKTVIFVAILGALGLAGGAQADDGHGADKAPQAGIRRVWIENLQPYQREYQLSNGETVTLTKRGNLMYAYLSSGPWHRVEATGRGSFAALDGSLKLHVDLRDDETVQGWLSLAPGKDIDLAGQQPQTVQFASSR
jgi:hypothetical protein